MSFWTAFVIVAAIWLLPGLLFAAWVLADAWLDGRDDTDDWPDTDTGWLDDLIAAEATPFYDDLCFAQWERKLGGAS